jgi:hypothetical protein
VGKPRKHAQRNQHQAEGNGWFEEPATDIMQLC